MVVSVENGEEQGMSGDSDRQARPTLATVAASATVARRVELVPFESTRQVCRLRFSEKNASGYRRQCPLPFHP